EAFLEGQRAGIFRTDVPPTIFKQTVFGALDQISTNWILSKSKKIDLAAAGECVGKILLEGVLIR
ncbi:MAG: TetR family transcriptional regulator, partial [candidate division KSB1 bacterium]|nr:TetR family transcriptional regulator [candidate division KSB1 bacterium]